MGNKYDDQLKRAEESFLSEPSRESQEFAGFYDEDFLYESWRDQKDEIAQERGGD